MRRMQAGDQQQDQIAGARQSGRRSLRRSPPAGKQLAISRRQEWKRERGRQIAGAIGTAGARGPPIPGAVADAGAEKHDVEFAESAVEQSRRTSSRRTARARRNRAIRSSRARRKATSAANREEIPTPSRRPRRPPAKAPEASKARKSCARIRRRIPSTPCRIASRSRPAGSRNRRA